MKKRPPSPPPLSLEALRAVEGLESVASRTLDHCGRWPAFNLEKAKRALSTCAVESLRLQAAFYSKLPQYHEDWIPELKERIVVSLVGLVGGSAELPEKLALTETLTLLLNRYAIRPPIATAPAETGADCAVIRRQEIDSFIAAMLAAGRRISRKEIWLVVGYTNRTEFERYQRCAKPENKRATRLFKTILAFSPEEFKQRLERLPRRA